MNYKRDFGNNVKFYRTRLGLTQTQLSEKVGVSQNSISSIETGQYRPTAYTAALLCEALQCKFEDLFYLLPM
jgi:putative transcriptional regulator